MSQPFRKRFWVVTRFYGLFKIFDIDIVGGKVRTRKIVSLSDLIASTSNVIAVAVTEAAAAITKNEILIRIQSDLST